MSAFYRVVDIRKKNEGLKFKLKCTRALYTNHVVKVWLKPLVKLLMGEIVYTHLPTNINKTNNQSLALENPVIKANKCLHY
jgi:hypothetical protein